MADPPRRLSRAELDALYEAAGRQFDIDPRLLRAMATHESGENPGAVSRQGALGIMQFIPETARRLGVDPHDPRSAIFGAARHMAENLQASNGNVEEALRLYHAGPSMTNRGPRTAAYPGLVAAQYRRLQQPQDAAPATAAPTQDARDQLYDQLVSRGMSPNAASIEVARQLPASRGPVPADAPRPTARPQAASVAAQPAPAAAPTGVDQDLIRVLTGEADVPRSQAVALDPMIVREINQDVAVPLPNPQIGNHPAPQRSGLENAVSGLTRGLRDVIDPAAEWLSGTRLGRAASSAFGLPTHEAVVAGDQQALRQYEGDTAGSNTAAAFRMPGQVVRDAAGIVGGVAEGAVRGARLVTDPTISLVSGTANRAGLPTPSSAEIDQQSAADRAEYLRRTGGSLASHVGEIAGTTAALAPVLGGAGTLIGAGARALLPNAMGRFVAGAAGTEPVANNFLAAGAQRAAGGAAAGGVAGAATASPGEDRLRAAAEGATTGAVLNPFLAPVARAVTTGIGNVIHPPVEHARAEVARRAQELGIPVYGPQLSSSSPVRYLDSHLRDVLGSGHAARTSAAPVEFTRNVARLIGENPMNGRIDAETRRRFWVRNSDVFQNVARGTTLRADPRVVQDLSDVHNLVMSTPMDTGAQNAFRQQIQNITQAFQGGSMSGDAYLRLTRHDSPLGRAMRSQDQNIRDVGLALRETLDGLLERNAPAEAARLREARRQYRDMVTLVRPATRTTEGMVDGLVNPVAFATAAARRDPRTGSYPMGQNIVNDLAMIGRLFVQPPNSGTAARTAISTGLLGAPSLGTAAAGLSFGSPEMVALGATGAGTSAAGANLLSRYLAGPGYAERMIRAGERNSPMRLPTPAERVAQQLRHMNRFSPVVGAVALENQDLGR